MKAENEKKSSLYLEWFVLLLLAGAVSILFFISSMFVIEHQIDRHYKSRNVSRHYNERYISKIQDYITAQEISSEDLSKLDVWLKDKRLIYVQIDKDGRCIYSSAAMRNRADLDEYASMPYPPDNCYDVRLSDGTVQMFIIGVYSDKLYMAALIADVTASFLLFFLLTMLGIRKKIVYIDRLSSDIEILEGGNLEYEVHVQGNDEITNLAKGLNAMKDSFKSQIEEVENLTRINHEIVTELSHDLRTPLTSCLLYAEILESGKYGDEQSRRDYLRKIIRKIQHMKELSDKLLAYSVSASEERLIPASFLSVYGALYDELSDMCGYLEEQGIRVKANLRWEEGSILVCEEYIVRILDNIASNILKYADAQASVLICNEYFKEEMCVIFENACDEKCSGGDGYSIGIRNVKMLMKEMGGSCEVMQYERHFRICLRFRYSSELR